MKMYKQLISIVSVLSLFVWTGCERTPSNIDKITELERRALLYSNDSLLNTVDSVDRDSTFLAVKDALKARNFGAADKQDSSAYYIRKVEDYCARAEPSERVYNVWGYVENIKAVNWIYTTSAMSPLRDSAVVALENSIRYSILGRSYERIPLSYYNISSVFSGRSQYARSAYYIRRAVFVSDSLKLDKAHCYFLYTGIGEDYLSMNDFRNSQRYLDKASHYLKHMPADDIVSLYTSYGDLYRQRKMYGKAVRYLEKALREVRKCKVAEEWAYYRALNAYAGTLVDANIRPAGAMKMLNQVLDYYLRENDINAVLSVRCDIIRLAIRRHDMALAQKHAAKALKEGIETEAATNSTRHAWYAVMEDYYRRTDNYKKAYSYNKRAVAIEDSINGYAQQQYIANLGLQYRQDSTNLAHRAFIRQQEAEISTLYWRYVAVALVAVIVLLSFLGYYIYTRRRRTLMYNRYIANINRLKMQNIRNCISPHFTFNVLNHEIELNAESGEKHNRLVDLAQLLRKSLDSTGQIAIPLASELDFISSYVRLLNECGKRFSYRLKTDDGIDTGTILIPSMILQIPVENAVKHGFLHDDPAHYVHIDIKKAESGIDIEIRNNGVPYSPFIRANKANSSGIGMQVIFQSLLMLNMKNKNKIVFTLSDRKEEGESGTIALIHIPYNFDYSVLER